MEKVKTNKLRKSEKAFFALADFYGGGGQDFIGVVYFFYKVAWAGNIYFNNFIINNI